MKMLVEYVNPQLVCFRNLAAGLMDEMSKPLKTLVDAQVKARKPVSFSTDMTVLTERKQADSSHKQAHNQT